MLVRLIPLLLLAPGREAWEYSPDVPSSFRLRTARQVSESIAVPSADPFGERDLQRPVNETEEYTAAGSPDVHISDHVYYKIHYHSPDEDKFNRFWLDSMALVKKYPNTSKADHPQLASSYRRAVSLVSSFPFPFYGHPLRNVTIATGGFCYVGDQMHSWLAATQYVAPLMSNFDTTPEGSTIIYADTGSLMVVEWRDVVLRNQPSAGNFSFQVSLHSNGSIWFVYKKVPLNVSDISDTHHPRKIGLSDAYLYEHKVHLESSLSANPVGKRVIYEYHRVEINESRIATHVVIEINPNPVCMALKSCEDCMNATLEHFNCSWCSSKDSGEPFCSDQDGLNRRRQDWNRGSCRHQTSMTYCTDTTPAPASSSSAATPASSRASRPPLPPKPAGSAQQHPHQPETSMTYCTDTTPAPASSSSAATPASSRASRPPLPPKPAGSAQQHPHQPEDVVSGGGGGVSVAGVLLVVALVLLIGGWIAYAYFNPHTPSGQLLIRYRPGKWRWPGAHGDVRYTASVHM